MTVGEGVQAEAGRFDRKEANFLLSDLVRGRGVFPGIGTSSSVAFEGEVMVEAGEEAMGTSVNSTVKRNVRSD